MHDDGPTLASLLRHGCQVTHFKNVRGWIETPDGRFFKPEPGKVQFIKGMNKPFVYIKKVKQRFVINVAELVKILFK